MRLMPPLLKPTALLISLSRPSPSSASPVSPPKSQSPASLARPRPQLQEPEQETDGPPDRSGARGRSSHGAVMVVPGPSPPLRGVPARPLHRGAAAAALATRGEPASSARAVHRRRRRAPRPHVRPSRRAPGAALLVPHTAPQAPRRGRGAPPPPAPPPPARADAAAASGPRRRRRGGDRRALRRRQAARPDGAEPAAQLRRTRAARHDEDGRRRGGGGQFTVSWTPSSSRDVSTARRPLLFLLSGRHAPRLRKGLTMEDRSTPGPCRVHDNNRDNSRVDTCAMYRLVLRLPSDS